MQSSTQQDSSSISPLQAAAPGGPIGAPNAPNVYTAFQIIRRNGAVVSFEPSKIAVALMKA